MKFRRLPDDGCMGIRADCFMKFSDEFCQAVGRLEDHDTFIFCGDFSDPCGTAAAFDREKTVKCKFIGRKSAGGNRKSQRGDSRNDLRLNSGFDRLPDQKKARVRDTGSSRIRHETDFFT